MLKGQTLIIVASLAIAAGRFLIPGHELSWAGTYETFAHILSGALAYLILTRNPYDALDTNCEVWTLRNEHAEKQSVAAVCLFCITILEVVMFLTR